MTLALVAVLPARTTFAHDAPTIPPARLDFDARQAPKRCNDKDVFLSILGNWVPEDPRTVDADRRIVVRIRRSPTGKKLADVTLMDATGTTLAHEYKVFASTTECYKVLYESALAAAKLLGAFEKPPPPEPCPACPTCPAPPEPPGCPVPAPLSLPVVKFVAPPRTFMRRGFMGAGVFLGTGITPAGAMGPHVALGFVPLLDLPRIQFEIDFTWAPQMVPTSNPLEVLRMVVAPVAASLCYSRYVFRVCGGLTVSYFSAEDTSLLLRNDEMNTAVAASVRLGTEFEIADPFSIRVDGLMHVRFWGRAFDNELGALNDLNPVAAGAVAMGVWSFE